MRKDDCIFVAGHRGMVGGAIERELRGAGYDHVLTRTRREMDLRDQDRVRRFFRTHAPDAVVLAAAWVGGISANISNPVSPILENLQIQTNVMEAASDSASTFLFVGSSCMYPRNCRQPMRVEDLLSGPLEQTNEGYAVAKLAGWRLLEALSAERGMRGIVTVPPNLFGPGDTFDLSRAHVVSALVRRFTDASVEAAPAVQVWGTGNARRELMDCRDHARAVRFLLEQPKFRGIINVGTGTDVSIAELASMIADVVGFDGRIEFDASRPDGMPQKLMDSSPITKMGWRPRWPLASALVEHAERYSRARAHAALEKK